MYHHVYIHIYIVGDVCKWCSYVRRTNSGESKWCDKTHKQSPLYKHQFFLQEKEENKEK